MTPAQSRAARGLLDITQTALATAAKVSLSTIVDFEHERREVSADLLTRLKLALEGAGVIFIAEDDEGPGVRLAKSRPKAKRKRSR